MAELIRQLEAAEWWRAIEPFRGTFRGVADF